MSIVILFFISRNYSDILKARRLGAKLFTTKEASNGFALDSFAICGKHLNRYHQSTMNSLAPVGV
jgi:hypothetical protein